MIMIYNFTAYIPCCTIKILIFYGSPIKTLTSKPQEKQINTSKEKGLLPVGVHSMSKLQHQQQVQQMQQQKLQTETRIGFRIRLGNLENNWKTKRAVN